MTAERCPGCHTRILPAQTTYGTDLAVDTHPTVRGNLVFVADGVVAVVDPAHTPGRVHYRAHTCPSGLWRGLHRELAAL